MSKLHKKLIVMVLAALGSIFMFTPNASAAVPYDTCPTVVPNSELESLVGDAGIKGYTVVSGTTVEEFDVDILGVQNNAWLPGDKIVIARASGAPITDNGIAAGMSGSPIYTADGRLIGALAYGFSYSPNDILGITPAEEMETTLEAPVTTYEKVKLSSSSRAAIAEETGVAARSVPSSLQRVPTVLSVTGSLKSKVGKAFAEEAQKRGMVVSQGPASSHQLGNLGPFGNVDPIIGETLQGGETIVADFSVGRTSVGGLGTVTTTCDDKFLAFGHPFMDDMTTRAIVSQGEIFTMIVDQTMGSYKYGVATNPVGTMTADNAYAIGGTLGTATPTIDVSGTISDESNGKSIDATFTKIAKMPAEGAGDTEAFIVPYAAAVSLSSEIQKLSGRGFFATGSANGGWTIAGSSDAGPFSFTRSDAFSGYEDDPAWYLYEDLSEILYYSLLNEGENIRIDSITPNLDMRSGLREFTLSGVEHRVAGSQRWVAGKKPVRAEKGQRFFVRFSFKANSGEVVQRVLTFRATKQQGTVDVYEGAWGGSEGEFGAQSLDQLLRYLGTFNNSKLIVDARGAKLLRGGLDFGRVVYGEYLIGVNQSGGSFGW